MRHAVTLWALGIMWPILHAAAAGAAADLTGTYDVAVSATLPATSKFSFSQSGTQLMLTFALVDPDTGVPLTGWLGPYEGTIDPDAGTFSVSLPDTPVPFPGLPTCPGNHIDGSAAPNAQTIEGTWVSHIYVSAGSCFDAGGPFTGSRSTCGDGVLDAGEQCDDGNHTDGDCCTWYCHFESIGSACSDGNSCTNDACDGAGSCQPVNNSAPCGTTCAPATCAGGNCAPGTPAMAGTTCDDGDVCTTADACDGAGACAGPPVVCDVCETCTAPGGCTSGPAPACFTVAGEAAVRLDLSRRVLSLASRGSAELDFGDPVASTDYEVCVFSHDGNAWSPLLAARAPGGGRCGGAPCWRATRTGFAYRSPAATPDGLTVIRLRERGSRIGATLRGRGADLQVPAQLPAQVSSLRLELRGADAQGHVCYATEFRNPTTRPPYRLFGRR